MTANLEMSCASNDDFATVPRDESGDFYYHAEPNPVVTSFDADQKVLYDRHGIVISRQPVEFEDGTRVNITSSTLHTRVPDGLEGVASYESTAWLTQPEGIYVSRLIHLGKLGLEGTVISSPKNFGKFPTVSENARNQLEVVQWEAKRLGRDPHHIINNGISEGHMIQNATVDIAEQFGVEVLYADGMVGCFANGLSWQAAMDALQKIPNELRCIRSIAKTSFNALVHLPRTLDVSRESLHTHLQAVPGLLNGDTGKHYAHRPLSTFGHHEQGDGDFLAQGREWVLLNQPFRNESMQLHPGSCHIDCVGNPSHESWNGRHETVAEVLRANPHIRTRMNGARLHDTLRSQAADLNPIFHEKPVV